MPVVVVFGGPNGAEKSTIAPAVLDALGVSIFVNADVIARGLNLEEPVSGRPVRVVRVNSHTPSLRMVSTTPRQSRGGAIS